jgi:hypothetical protein
MAGRGQVPTSPPVSFAVYGVDPALPGARWLESYGDALGDPVRYVGLARLSADASQLTIVETHSREMTDAAQEDDDEPGVQAVAFAAAFTLLNLTLPDSSVPRPEGFHWALVDLAVERGQDYPDWTPVTWQVDGRPVTARAWEFAGGWAAFCDGLDDVYLAVASSGGRSEPDGLALTRLRQSDTGAYHVDLSQPLPPGIRQQSRDAARTDELEWREPADWHPDQLHLLGQ